MSYLISTKEETLNNFFLGSTEIDEIKILKRSKLNAITKNYSLIFQLLKKIVDG